MGVVIGKMFHYGIDTWGGIRDGIFRIGEFMVTAKKEMTNNAMGALFVSISDLSDMLQVSNSRTVQDGDRLTNYIMMEWQVFDKLRNEQN